MHRRGLSALSPVFLCLISISIGVYATGGMGLRVAQPDFSFKNKDDICVTICCTTTSASGQVSTMATLTTTTTTQSQTTTVTLTLTTATVASTTSSPVSFPSISDLSLLQILGLLATFWLLATAIILVALARRTKRLTLQRVQPADQYAKVMVPARCLSCGAQRPPLANVCPQCGNRLD